MFGKKQPEVLVVGAGPVGLFSALLLARKGVHVQVIDEAWRTGTHAYALALHPGTLRLLDEVGLLVHVLDRAYRVRRIGLYDLKKRRAELSFSGLEEDFSFVAVLRQDVLESLLEHALAEHGVKVMWNHRLSHMAPDGAVVDATVDRMVKESMGYAVAHTEWVVSKSTNMRVPFVLGADGHQSEVRKALKIPFEEVGPAQFFAVFEFKSNADLNHEARIVFDEHSSNVVWPLPDGHCRWSFQMEDDFPGRTTARTKDRFIVQLGTRGFPLLSQERLIELIAERAPWFLGSVEEVEWRMVVRFERRMAQSFGRGGVWLAGDAGHMTGPVGVQSMNVGMREGYDLAAAIAAILRDKKDDALLAAYDRDRRLEWQRLLGLDGGPSPGTQTDPWLRHYIDRLVPSIPATGLHLTGLLAQLGLEERAS